MCYCESANEFTDDKNVSWKVQRAAAKCLAALIVYHPEMLAKLYEEVPLHLLFNLVIQCIVTIVTRGF